MASVFGHALTAIAIGNSFSKRMTNIKFWFLGITCSILPDADVAGFSYGIPYDSFWGHRGFSHSLLFAFLTGIFITLIFYKNFILRKKGLLYILFFTFCTASHGILDAMTTGGFGVAFFSPFDTTRYFFSWRPIRVSPIGIEHFFGEWGMKVIKNELVWIGIPSFLYILSAILLRKFSTRKTIKDE